MYIRAGAVYTRVVTRTRTFSILDAAARSSSSSCHVCGYTHTHTHQSPAVVGSLGGDGPVGQMDPGRLLGLLLDSLVVLPHPGLLFLQDHADA